MITPASHPGTSPTAFERAMLARQRIRRWVPAVLAYASAVSVSVAAAAALVAADLPTQTLIAVI